MLVVCISIFVNSIAPSEKAIIIPFSNKTWIFLHWVENVNTKSSLEYDREVYQFQVLDATLDLVKYARSH